MREVDLLADPYALDGYTAGDAYNAGLNDGELSARAEVERLRAALEEIDAKRDQAVYSMSRGAMDGNEAFMLGANTAFSQAAAIARTALEGNEDRGESRRAEGTEEGR